MMALRVGDEISLRLPQFTCPNSTGTLMLDGRSKDVFSGYSQWDEGTKHLRLVVGGTGDGIVIEEQLSVSVRVRFSAIPTQHMSSSGGGGEGGG